MSMDAILEDLREMQRGVCPACGKDLSALAARSHQFTCSDTCHRAWIDALVARHGETREITHGETGTVYLVPTRVILEQGITGSELPRFPVKGRPSITCPVCQRVSYHPTDIAERYCGFCHQFQDDARFTRNSPPGGGVSET